MKASDLMVKCLEAEGVERIFGVPGEENADMMISVAGLEDRVRVVPARAGRGFYGRYLRPSNR